MNLRDIHTPVLLDRCVELLAPALQEDGAVLVDATLGMGGHSEALLERFSGIRLIGLDRDTPDPANGHIVCDAAGEPTGMLHEDAIKRLRKALNQKRKGQTHE